MSNCPRWGMLFEGPVPTLVEWRAEMGFDDGCFLQIDKRAI